jgi:hypothetical protein
VARGLRRSGAGAYALGDHPLHVLLYSFRHLRGDSGALGMANYLAGWVGAALRRGPRADPDLRTYIRNDELRRIRRRASLLMRPATHSTSAL